MRGVPLISAASAGNAITASSMVTMAVATRVFNVNSLQRIDA
jgi:hypothetical protein